uniref:hypothetical protein n=1 Tax=Marinobacterium profundum TaxID=1714300 RepID=UPI000829FDA0|nr:hypothetical protein [Marinobacterium profundum]
MGYLADIVADARERHFGESALAYSEEVLEVSQPGENVLPSTTPDNHQPTTPTPPIEQGPDTLDSAKSQAPDLPPARKQRPKPESAKDPHDASAQESAQEPLYQYLQHLSQQTLIARSEKILTQQQNPNVPAAPKVSDMPRTEQQKSPSDSHENTRIPAARIATGTRMDSSDKSAVPPVQDNGPAPATVQTIIQTIQDDDFRVVQDTQDPHQRRSLPDDVKIKIHKDRQPSPVTSVAPKREQQTSAPPRHFQECASDAPQLRIGQINVVVESTRPDQDRRSGLERESDSASRYFLRSL